jgi:hypothetical protein
MTVTAGMEPEEEKRSAGDSTNQGNISHNVDEAKSTPAETSDLEWKNDKHNPYNWPKARKNIQLLTIMSIAFTWYVWSERGASSLF